MIRYLNPFKPQTLAAGNNVAYVVPGLSVAQIRALSVHNTGTNPVSVEVYLVPASGSVQTSNRLVKKTLTTDESYLCPEVVNHVLTEGMQVVLVGQGANATLSIMEQSV